MKLSRSASDRMFGGVCGGIARYFGWDTFATRLITAASLLLFGSGAFIYLGLWILMPLDDL